MHIIFAEKVPGSFQEVWRIIYCHNLLILKLEEWLPSGSTQHLQVTDIVGTHVIDSGNNVQSSILAYAKNLLQLFHEEASLSASTYEVVRNWLLPLSMQTTDHKKKSMICNIARPLCSIVLITLNTVKLLIKTDILSD